MRRTKVGSRTENFSVWYDGGASRDPSGRCWLTSHLLLYWVQLHQSRVSLAEKTGLASDWWVYLTSLPHHKSVILSHRIPGQKLGPVRHYSTRLLLKRCSGVLPSVLRWIIHNCSFVVGIPDHNNIPSNLPSLRCTVVVIFYDSVCDLNPSNHPAIKAWHHNYKRHL